MDTISVKEYARIKGISVQAVYRKMKTPLFLPYIRQESGGQTRLDIAILDDPQINDNSTKHSAKHSTVERFHTTVDSTVESQQKPSDPRDLDDPDHSTVEQDHSTVDSTVDNCLKPSEMPSESPLEAELRNRISDKDAEIERLIGQLNAKDEQIREKDQQIKSLQESLQAAQLIQAKQMQIQIPEKTETAAAQGSGFLAKLKAWWNSTAPQA